MKAMKNGFIIYVASILIILNACTEDTTVMIRVKNVSTFNYKNVIIGKDTFGDIAVGQYSNYKIYHSAYRYNSYHLIADNDTIDMFATDFVGEKLLESGNYTYQIDAKKDDNNRTYTLLQCVRD